MTWRVHVEFWYQYKAKRGTTCGKLVLKYQEFSTSSSRTVFPNQNIYVEKKNHFRLPFCESPIPSVGEESWNDLNHVLHHLKVILFGVNRRIYADHYRTRKHIISEYMLNLDNLHDSVGLLMLVCIFSL